MIIISTKYLIENCKPRSWSSFIGFNCGRCRFNLQIAKAQPEYHPPTGSHGCNSPPWWHHQGVTWVHRWFGIRPLSAMFGWLWVVSSSGNITNRFNLIQMVVFILDCHKLICSLCRSFSDCIPDLFCWWHMMAAWILIFSLQQRSTHLCWSGTGVSSSMAPISRSMPYSSSAKPLALQPETSTNGMSHEQSNQR